MIRKWTLTIPPLTGWQRRRAYVYLPRAAQLDPAARFPVLYMFDGHNVFFDADATYGKSWGMKDYMDYTETPLIVAAVECNRNPNNGRLSEYSPFSFEDPGLGKIRGRGRTTMEWMVNTFKPMIDRRFPTIPDRAHTFIGGSSMGGLMSLYAVTEYNHIYSRAAALSPSVWVSPDRLDQILDRASIAPDTVVYMDYGSEELDNHPDMRSRFGQISGKLLERGVLLNSRIVPGGDHSEGSWEQQVPFFMNTLLYGVD